MRHLRKQQSIGQGFFHTGMLGAGFAEFRYIYDCGSMSTRRVNECIDAQFNEMSPKKIDVLFLSHLHEDHISGLDHLFTRVQVDSVFLPLLSPEARLSCIVTSVEEGCDTVGRVDFISDRGGWLRARGVRQVFFVVGDDAADGGVAPREPSPPVDSGEVEDDGTLRIDEQGLGRFSRDTVTPPLSRTSSGSRARAMLSPGDRVVSHLAPIHITESANRLLDWVFITYVFPDEELELRLRSALRPRVGEPPRKPATFHAWILDILRHPEKRAELIDCVEGCGVRQNFMSMSLYSGPTAKYRPTFSIYAPTAEDSVLLEEDRCGWLGAGDSELATKTAWQRFENHYRQVLPRVHTLAVPHHGARRNFNPALLGLGAQDFVVSSRSQNRHHPAKVVRSQLEENARLHHVTQQPETAFTQDFRRHV
jgi:hypothetical protein